AKGYPTRSTSPPKRSAAPAAMLDAASTLAEHEQLCRQVAGHFYPPAGHDRADLEQEARIAVLEGLRSYDGRIPLRPFLGLCIRRQLLDLLKAARQLK